MKCMFYRTRRRASARTPQAHCSRPRQPKSAIPNSFYGLDTVSDPFGGMVPMQRDGATGNAYPNLRMHSALSPEEAVDNGALLPEMYVPGVKDTYR